MGTRQKNINRGAAPPKVFICYASADISKAQEIFFWLKGCGADPWFDKERLVSGDQWDVEIRQAVAAADVFVVCLRPGFDDIGFRQNEVREAIRALENRPPGRAFIIPFIVRPCTLPEWCKPFHAGADLSKPTSLQELRRAIEKHCGVSLVDERFREEFPPLIQRAIADEATMIDWSDKGLPPLPPEIGQLTNLESLALRWNNLVRLPPEIGHLTKLKWLDLGDNELTELPSEIGRLCNLEVLFVYRNPLTKLPPEIGNLHSLKRLILYRTRLTALPSAIGRLSELEQLDLGATHFAALPPELAQLMNLKDLKLITCGLSAFPTEITKLKNLRKLNLKRNRITRLPPGIGNLTNLEVLGLQFNRLTTLPSEICELNRLRQLDLMENPLPIPYDILKSVDEPEKIIDFWQRTAGRKSAG